MRDKSTVAWVESPLQLVGAAEWADAATERIAIAGRLTPQMSETADGTPRDRNHHLVTTQQALQTHNTTLRAFLEALAPILEPEGTFDLREIVWKAEALTRPFSKPGTM